MIVNQRILFCQVGDELFDRFPFRFAVNGAGGLDRLHAVIPDGFDDFLFTQVDKGADHGQIRSVQVGFRLEGADLTRIQEIQQQSFHRVVVVMSVGHFVALMLVCVAVDCSASEKGAGEAGGVFRLAADDLGDIDLVDFMGDFQR